MSCPAGGPHTYVMSAVPAQGPVCMNCGLSYAQLNTPACTHAYVNGACVLCGASRAAAPTPPSSPARQPFYGSNALPPPVKLPAVSMQWYPETAPRAADFDEVRLAAMEEKCPGAGFTVEGHKARKGTVEYVDAGVVQVFCDKCRAKVVVFLAT